MRTGLFSVALIAALAAQNGWAQTPPPGQATGHPANICQELIAYLEQAEAEKAKAAATRPAGEAAPGQSPAAAKSQPSSAATQLSIAQVKALAQANDLRGCQAVAQQMRRAGAALPPGLLALAALEEKQLLQAAAAR